MLVLVLLLLLSLLLVPVLFDWWSAKGEGTFVFGREEGAVLVPAAAAAE